MKHARHVSARTVTIGSSLLALLLAFAPAAAHAAGAKRAGVPKFDGAQEALIRKQVMKVLKAHGYELAKSREMDTGVQNSGALLESDDGFQKVAKELALAVIITGEVGKKRAKIIVHDGREGSVLGEASFPGANPRKMAAEVGRTFWSKLGPDLERGHTPSGSKKPQKAVAEAPEDDENAPESGGDAAAAPGEEKKTKVAASEASDSPSSSDGDGDSGSRRTKRKKSDVKMDDNVLREEASSEPTGRAGIPPTFELAAGAGGVNRSYSYNQDVSGLRPYNLPLGGAADVQAVWYPIAAFNDGPLSNLGLQLNVEQAFGVQSSIGSDGSALSGATFGTSIHEFEGGIRYRIPFGEAANQLWFSGSGGEHAFLFTGRSKYTSMDPTNPNLVLDIPDAIYRYMRAGAGLRLELPSDLSVSVSLGYRYIFNSGGVQFTQFFPHATVQGVDASAYLGYRIMENVEIRAGAELRRYFSSMHSTLADQQAAMASNLPKIAGGAIDQYLSFGAGLAFLYGGSPRPAALQEAPPAPSKHHRHHQDDEGGGEDGGDKPSGDESSGGGSE